MLDSNIALDRPQTQTRRIVGLSSPAMENLIFRQKTNKPIKKPFFKDADQDFFFYNQSPGSEYLELQRTLLQQHYIIFDSNDFLLEIFREAPTIPQVLLDAVAPLKEAFGEQAFFHFVIPIAEEDSFIKVAVQLPANFHDPEAALRSFQSHWWINNCHRSNGTLIFDYELQDAV